MKTAEPTNDVVSVKSDHICMQGSYHTYKPIKQPAIRRFAQGKRHTKQHQLELCTKKIEKNPVLIFICLSVILSLSLRLTYLLATCVTKQRRISGLRHKLPGRPSLFPFKTAKHLSNVTIWYLPRYFGQLMNIFCRLPASNGQQW